MAECASLLMMCPSKGDRGFESPSLRFALAKHVEMQKHRQSNGRSSQCFTVSFQLSPPASHGLRLREIETAATDYSSHHGKGRGSSSAARTSSTSAAADDAGSTGIARTHADALVVSDNADCSPGSQIFSWPGKAVLSAD